MRESRSIAGGLYYSAIVDVLHRFWERLEDVHGGDLWLESVFNFRRPSRFVTESSMKSFAPRIAMTLQVDQSSPILSLEIVSDEVLPVVSIINKKISPEEERLPPDACLWAPNYFWTVTLLFEYSELAHQVFTLTNRNTRNQYSARDAAFGKHY